MSEPDPSYTPSEEILRKYAEVLVKFALGSGKGVQPSDVVECFFPEVAKPLAKHVNRVLLEEGAHPMMQMQSDQFDQDFYQFGSPEQLQFFPESYLKAKAELLDHVIHLIDPAHQELPPEIQNNFLVARGSRNAYLNWLRTKELSEHFSWTAGIWGSEAAADQAHLGIEQYWQELIRGCNLDLDDPISAWRETFTTLHTTCRKLDELQIQELHFQGSHVDLKVQLGVDRQWLGGRGRNIPSYEVFTSPDWRHTSGWVRTNQDVYYYGATIKDAEFYFENGVVTKAIAQAGQHSLETLLQQPGMNKMGEISMTDKLVSRIQRPLGVTVFDENFGGQFGNFHFALGKSFPSAYTGSAGTNLEELGFNQSAFHLDFVSTSDRTVTATLADGSQRIIYQAGSFTL